jgi:hypothetical protein
MCGSQEIHMQSHVRIKLLSTSDEGTGLSLLPKRERKQGLCCLVGGKCKLKETEQVENTTSNTVRAMWTPVGERCQV